MGGWVSRWMDDWIAGWVVLAVLAVRVVWCRRMEALGDGVGRGRCVYSVWVGTVLLLL